VSELEPLSDESRLDARLVASLARLLATDESVMETPVPEGMIATEVPDMDVGVPDDEDRLEELSVAVADELPVAVADSTALETMLETEELSDRTDVGATTATVDPAESVVRMLDGAELELSDPRALDRTLETVALSDRTEVGPTTATVLPNESVVNRVEETSEAVPVAVEPSVDTAEAPIA